MRFTVSSPAWMLTGVLTIGLFLTTPATGAASAADAYKAMGIKTGQVLTGTGMRAKVVPGDDKQFIQVTTYMTGKKNERWAVNVRLDVFQIVGNRLIEVYTRNFGEEAGGFVGDGDLQLADLDLDGVQEIVVSYRKYGSPVITERHGEVLRYTDRGFEAGWVGPLEYDATKAVREVPEERRDRFKREIDLEATLRSRGTELHLDKKVIAIAGERLAEPRQVDEIFPLKTR